MKLTQYCHLREQVPLLPLLDSLVLTKRSIDGAHYTLAILVLVVHGQCIKLNFLH